MIPQNTVYQNWSCLLHAYTGMTVQSMVECRQHAQWGCCACGCSPGADPTLQEYFLIALSQPRQEPESSSSSSSGESGDDQETVLQDLDSPAVRNMRKSLMFQHNQKLIREEATKQTATRHRFRLPVCHPSQPLPAGVLCTAVSFTRCSSAFHCKYPVQVLV